MVDEQSRIFDAPFNVPKDSFTIHQEACETYEILFIKQKICKVNLLYHLQQILTH